MTLMTRRRGEEDLNGPAITQNSAEANPPARIAVRAALSTCRSFRITILGMWGEHEIFFDAESTTVESQHMQIPCTLLRIYRGG